MPPPPLGPVCAAALPAKELKCRLEITPGLNCSGGRAARDCPAAAAPQVQAPVGKANSSGRNSISSDPTAGATAGATASNSRRRHNSRHNSRHMEAFRRLFAQGNSSHSYEDAQNLLENLMLISALLLAFSVGGLQSLDHDDMLAADARYLAVRQSPVVLARDASSLWHQPDPERILAGRWVPGDLLSYRCLTFVLSSVVVQISTLSIAVALYVSLSFSNAREDKGHFELWIFYCKWIIAGDYVLQVIGIFMLFECNMIMVDLKLPMYNRLNLSGAFDNNTKEMVEGGDWMLQMEGYMYKLWTITVVGSVLGVIFLMHFVFLLKSRRVNDVDSEDDEDDEMRVNDVYSLQLPEGATTFTKWKSVLDKAGMDFKTCASIHDDFLLRKELEKAGVSIPGDRLKIILELRSSD